MRIILVLRTTSIQTLILRWKYDLFDPSFKSHAHTDVGQPHLTHGKNT